MLLLKISWILLLAVGVALLGFGILLCADPGIAAPADAGLLRALGASTAGMGAFGVLIAAVPYRRREKWAWFILWCYPGFWVFHLAGGLPPGRDRMHQVILI